MSFAFRKRDMAQALSIVGEAGIHGIEYNGLLESWLDNRTRQSNRSRISVVSAKTFSGKEFEDYLILAWRFGYLDRSKYREVEWKWGLNKSSYDLENEEIRLTKAGWEYIDSHDDPIIERWLKQVLDNIPVILVSVAATLLAAWIIRFFGWG